MKITNPITLDVARSNSYICLLGKQFDSNSRYLQVTLTNNGQPLPIPSGAGVVLRATRADGAGSMTAGTVNGDGTALVEIDETVLEVAGAASLSIEVTSGGQVLTSASCNLSVQKADASGWVKVYVAAASVSAGTYHISLGGQSYSFTTTQTIPAGGAIYFNTDGGTAQTRDASGNVLDASLTLTAGTSGTELTSDVPTMTFLAALAQQVGELADTDNLVAGSAEALLGGGTAENVAVALRGNAGNAREKIGKLIGGTIAWNQVQKTQTVTAGTYHDVVFSNVTNAVHIQGTASALINNIYFNSTDYPTNTVGNHVYILAGCPSSAGATTFYTEPLIGAGADWVKGYPKDYGNGTIFKSVGTNDVGDHLYGVRLVVTNGASVNADVRCCVTDLTTVLGPTIADYVHTLESGTAGAGVAWLARYFPKILGGYYAYSAPALQSVNVEGKKISGFNLWDEEWESGIYSMSTGNPSANASYIRSKNPIPAVPTTNHFFLRPAGATDCVVLFYDNEGIYLGSYESIGSDRAFTVPAGAKFMKFYVDRTTYNHDICINLSNPLLNGQYFPHREFYYPIQSGELRGQPKLDANNNLTFIGDEIVPNGTKTIRRARVNLGSLDWNMMEYSGMKLFYASNPTQVQNGINYVCTKYPCAGVGIGGLADKNSTGYGGAGTNIWIRDDSYNGDTAAFKAGNAGVLLEYELATPYTEAGQPFLAVERLDNGSEEVVDAGVEAGTRDVVVPVGQDATIYRDLAALLGAIPNPPASAGTYTLHATVTSTNATFSWS